MQQVYLVNPAYFCRATFIYGYTTFKLKIKSSKTYKYYTYVSIYSQSAHLSNSCNNKLSQLTPQMFIKSGKQFAVVCPVTPLYHILYYQSAVHWKAKDINY